MNDQFFELNETDNEEELLAFDQEDEAGDYEEEFDAHEFAGEEREIELAAELLGIADEQELDQFLGKLLRGARGVLNTAGGQKLKDLLLKTAKKAVPLAGQAIGGYFGGQRGAAFGRQIATAGGQMFGLETEGMSPEDRELHVARRFVRLAGDAAQKLSNASSGNPAQAAQSALLAAARRHAPGLASLITVNDHRTGSGARRTVRIRDHRQGEDEMHDLDRTLRSQESENEADFEADIFGEAESDFEEETYALSEEQEIDLAAEMLAISDDRELDQFLGGLLKKARGAIGPALKKYILPVARKLAPIAGTAVGGFFGDPVGAKLGGKIGSFASTLFEVDFESMDTESQEMEVARNFVRFASAAANNAAAMPATADPNTAAKKAIVAAAKTHAPGLLRNRGRSGGGYSANVAPARCRPTSGRWIRYRGGILLKGL